MRNRTRTLSFRRRARPRLPCKERERLEKAYENAQLERFAIEERVERELVSKDRNQAKRAKKRCEAALKHAVNIMEELRVHGLRHGCA